MRLYNAKIHKRFALLAILGLVLSCSKSKPVEEKPPEEKPPEKVVVVPVPPKPEAVSAPTLWMKPKALIKSGENPLWFIVSPAKAGEPADTETAEEKKNPGTPVPGGLTLLDFPDDEAAVKAFEPWPLARLVSAMLVQEDRLILGVNRLGFLVFRPGKDDTIAYYPLNSEEQWGNYTISALFVYEDKGTERTAALLSRNDSFVEPTAPPPAPRVFTLVQGSAQPQGLPIPAFLPFSSEEGWDIDSLRYGPDGYWYYRAVQRGSSAQVSQILYLQDKNLAQPGEAVSLGEFRQSALPEPLDKAPPVLRLALDQVCALIGKDTVGVATVISPEFPYTRHFTPNPALFGKGEKEEVLTGYYSGGETTSRAVIILGSGKGYMASADVEGALVYPVSLPVLPADYVYTHIALMGTTIIASWEEQDSLSVGAAGFMMRREPDIPDGLTPVDLNK